MDNDVYFTNDKRISFLMIPWALITEPMFHGLSMESKVLYAMMLDRMGLSKRTTGAMSKNGCSSTIR
jgi:hypothetical protein